jgi:integrase/recombinase XerC
MEQKRGLGKLTHYNDEKLKLGTRDFALLSLLYGTGLRSQEAVNLRLNQIDFENEIVTIIGKGDDERRVWAVKGVIAALQRWLEYHTLVDGEGLSFSV